MSDNATDVEYFPITPLTSTFIAIEAAVFLFTFSVLGYVWWHRNYLPIAVKQVPLVILSMINDLSCPLCFRF